jgi:hypothetical protein
MTTRLQHDAAFERFITENPEVYRRFRLLAVKLKAKGITRWGAKSLWEVLRWELAVETNASVKEYRLNNNHVSRMARKLMAEEPEEFGGFFELRQLKGGEEHPAFLGPR